MGSFLLYNFKQVNKNPKGSGFNSQASSLSSPASNKEAAGQGGRRRSKDRESNSTHGRRSKTAERERKQHTGMCVFACVLCVLMSTWLSVLAPVLHGTLQRLVRPIKQQR